MSGSVERHVAGRRHREADAQQTGHRFRARATRCGRPRIAFQVRYDIRAQVFQQRPRHGPWPAPRAVRDAALFRFRLLHGRVEVVDAQLRRLAADVDLGPLLVGGHCSPHGRQCRGSPHDEGPPAARAAEEHGSCLSAVCRLPVSAREFGAARWLCFWLLSGSYATARALCCSCARIKRHCTCRLARAAADRIAIARMLLLAPRLPVALVPAPTRVATSA